MTLTELLVVVAVMAILMSVSVPVAKKLMESYQSSAGARELIDAALSNARAIAVREQVYAGVRFQQKDEITYIVLIIHDFNTTGDEEGFRVVLGRKPLPLPEDVKIKHATIDGALVSVVFSPSGKLTTHRVRCMAISANDTMFNTQTAYDSGQAMFVADEEADEQDSVRTFTLEIGDKTSTETISPYTGELIVEYK